MLCIDVTDCHYKNQLKANSSQVKRIKGIGGKVLNPNLLAQMDIGPGRMMHRHCHCNLHFHKSNKMCRLLITLANSINVELPNWINKAPSFICGATNLIKTVAVVFVKSWINLPRYWQWELLKTWSEKFGTLLATNIRWKQKGAPANMDYYL